MAVLITGGCGLAGSFAVRYAVEQRQKVVVYDLALKTELLDDILDKITLIRGDVLQASELARAVQDHDIDRILHAASFLTPASYERPQAAVQTSVMGTLNVLECARLFGLKRVVYVSTAKAIRNGPIYGNSVESGKIALEPDPYTSAKIACELFCNDYRRMYQIDVVIVRFEQVFGPGYSFAGASGRAFKELVEQSLKREPVELNLQHASHSRAVISMLYAADAGRAAMLATLAEGLKDYVFNIRAKEALTLWEAADLLKELVPEANVRVSRGPEKGGPQEIDLRVKEQIGYVPEYTARRGFEEYLAFLKTGRYLKTQ